MDRDYVIRQGEGVPFIIDDAVKAFENEQRILRSIRPTGPFESIEELEAWANSLINTQGVSVMALLSLICQQRDITLQYLYLLHESPQPVTVPKDTLDRKCFVCGCDWFHACPGGCWWVEDDLCSTCQEKLQRHWWGRLRLWLHRKRGA